jgi:hypothetical protein
MENDELERLERKRSLSNLRFCPGFCLERLRKTTNLSHDSRSPVQDMNMGPPEYEAIFSKSFNVLITICIAQYIIK